MEIIDTQRKIEVFCRLFIKKIQNPVILRVFMFQISKKT